MRLDELEKDPIFATLDYGEQTALRSEWFERNIASAPEWATTTDDEKRALFGQAVDRMPVLEQAESDYFRKASAAVLKMKAGDATGVGEAIDLAAWRAGTKELLIPTLASQGIDAMMRIFSSKPDDTLYGDYYGRDGDKVGEWLAKQVATYGGESALRQLTTEATVVGVLGGFAEFALETVAMGGIGGAIGKGAGIVKGAKLALPGAELVGAARGAELGASLMTGEKFGRAARVALEQGGRINSALVRNLAAVTVEGVTSGVTQTGLDLVRLGLQEGLKDKSLNEWWTTIANSFGTNVAMNYVGWAALGGARTAVKALAKAGKGIPLAPAKDFIEAFRMESASFLRGASREYVEGEVGPQAARVRVSRLDPRDEAGFDVLARSAGMVPTFHPDGTVSLHLQSNPDIKWEPMPRRVAELRVAEMQATGAPTRELNTTRKSLKDDGVPIEAQASLDLGRGVAYKRTTYRLSELPPTDRLGRFLYPENGVVQPDRMLLYARSYLREQGVDPRKVDRIRIETHSQDIGGRHTSKGDTIVVDARIKSHGDEALIVDNFIRDLDAIVAREGKKASPRTGPFDLRPPSVEDNFLSFTAVKAAGAKLGVKVDVRNSRIWVDGVEAKSLAEANSAILGKAFEAGRLSDDQLSAIIARRHGYSVEVKDVPVMSPKGSARRVAEAAKGKPELTERRVIVKKITKNEDGRTAPRIVAEAPDWGTLFTQHPELDPKLPSHLAPDAFVYDAKANTITVDEVMATGSATQLIDLTGTFTSPTSPVIDMLLRDGVLEKVDGTDRFIYRDRSFGIVGEFRDRASAVRYMTVATESTTRLRDAFAMRDMRMRYAGDGTIVAVAPDGSKKAFRTVDEAQAWIEATPYAEWMREMMPVDEKLITDAKKGVDDAVRVVQASIDKTLFPGREPSKVVLMASKWLMPTELALEVGRRSHGNPTLLEAFKRLKVTMRVTQAMDTKADAAIDGIFRGTKFEDRVMYQVLLGNDSSRWATIARDGFNRELKDVDIERLNKAADFYKVAFEAANIPDWRRVFAYAPRIRDWAEAHKDEVISTVNAKEFLEKVFGTTPSGFEFFGEKARAADILKIALYEDAEQVMKSYTYALNKHVYMDATFREVKNIGDGLAGKIPEDELNFFRGALDEMQNATKTEQSAMFQKHSKASILGIQKILRKVPLVKNMPLANEPLVGDVIDLFNAQMTLATQAKPWAIVRNMMQLSLLGAVIGDNNVMWQAFKDILNEPADATLQRLMSTGAVAGSGHAAMLGASSSSELGLWRRLMKMNENMDILTRSASFRASELLIERDLPLLKAKKITEAQFLQRTGMTILDEPARLRAMDALYRGDTKLAIDLHGDTLNRLCFMDYSKVNRAAVQRGIVGKVFGKFGTYPLGALGLYQRILTSGSLEERIGRAARLVATSTAIYAGFQMAGIRYQGFLATDPFTFQGGPLWHLLADGSQFVGDSSQAKQARASLLRNLPRLVSPTINTFGSIQKAMKALDEGDTYGAALLLSGAPYRRETLYSPSP